MDLAPRTPEELAEALGSAASRKQSIRLGGRFSKRGMAGPDAAADVTISAAGLGRILQYEPRDLTISVEAGMPWCHLAQTLAERGQMIPLDPPFLDSGTVGGVVAANLSGPRRLLYGTARDMVIGMKFATLEGKLVQSGGMVVKNVAGLDMAKLIIGSFGTLAAIAVVNFKVIPRPSLERSFLLAFESLAEAISARDALLASPLRPAALDLLNPEAAQGIGRRSYVLAAQAGGNQAAVARVEHELGRLGQGVAVEDTRQETLWRYIQEFTPRFTAANPDGAMTRVSCTLKDVGAALESASGPAIARAGTGVVYGWFPHPEGAAEWASQATRRGWKAVIDFAPEEQKPRLELWPSPGGDLEIMKRIKHTLDPDGLLNRGRLYSRI